MVYGMAIKNRCSGNTYFLIVASPFGDSQRRFYFNSFSAASFLAMISCCVASFARYSGGNRLRLCLPLASQNQAPLRGSCPQPVCRQAEGALSLTQFSQEPLCQIQRNIRHPFFFAIVRHRKTQPV